MDIRYVKIAALLDIFVKLLFIELQEDAPYMRK